MDDLSKLFDILDGYGLLSYGINHEENVELLAIQTDSCARTVDMLFTGGVYVDGGMSPVPLPMVIDTYRLEEILIERPQ